MEEYLSSSEAFAKALKGFQTSPSEKIILAKEAWQRSDVVLPHKQEFLLEWLCNTLTKASTPSRNTKDDSSNTLLDQGHWDLLRDMLNGIALNRKKHNKYGRINARHHDGIAGSANSITDNQAPGVLLRVPVIPMFTALVQRIAPVPLSTQQSVSTPKQEKRSKKASTHAPAMDSVIGTPSESVLVSASASFELLSSPLMSEWFQPTLEQYTPLVQATLEALVEMTQESSNVNNEKQLIVMTLAHVVLDRFKHLVVIQANQKKVFALVAGKMFEGLIRARVAIRRLPGPSTAECQEAIGAILRTGLFHQEHLQEYTAGYVAGDEKSIQSYQKQLFEQVATLVKSEHATTVLDVLPVLLRYFVEESRRKQRGLANSGFDRGVDNARETEFSFFKIIYVLARKQLPHLTEDPSQSSIEELANIMDAHNNLLATILELNMYQPSNDETADQFVFMSTSFGSIYSCLTTAKTLRNGRLQSISLIGIVVLAQLDDRLSKPHLDSLWPVLFSPMEGANDAALELAETLLEIYGKTSDLKIFLDSLFSSLRNYLTRPEELRASPLFSKDFLDLVPANIRNYLPLPQAPMILDIFVTELMALDTSMEIETAEPIQELGHKKKRKLNSGKSKEHMDGTSEIPSAEPITAIFIQFLKGLRVTANQEKQLNKEFKNVYEHFLGSTFGKLASKGLERSESYQARRLTPALKLHYALCKISTQYWENGINMDLMNSIVKTFKGTSGWSDATVLTLNRVVLQHVHLTLHSAKNMDEDLVQSCREFVRFTMESSQLERLQDDNSLVLEPWNGRLESASGNSFLVASWQIHVNDWLDIVCRFGTTQHMELIAQVIAKQFSTPYGDCLISKGSLTIHLLNQILLRSANFYEVPNFRPVFARTVLRRFADSVAALSQTSSEKELASMVSSFTETVDSSGDSTNKVTFLDAFKKLTEVMREREKTGKRKSEAKEKHGTQLLSLLSIMHLLPLEYFEKYERNIILATMAVLEYFIQKHLDADATGVKCLLLSRRVANAIMTWRSDAGILTHRPEILLLLLEYPVWNCSSSYGSEDKDGVGHAIMDTTCFMIDNAIRYYMVQMHDAIQFESAYTHLSVLLGKAQEWALDDLPNSRATYDRRLTVSGVRVTILSRACQSLVHCLEMHHHQKKSKSKSKESLSNTAAGGMDSKQASIKEKIEALFEAVQANIAVRIEKAVSLTKLSPKMSKDMSKELLVKEAVESMDQLELYRTIVNYRQLGDETNKSKSLNLVPDLFHLAKALVQESVEYIQESQHVDSGKFSSISLIHMAATLTGYSCQYLPQSKSWKSGGSEATLKELLVLLFAISGQNLQEKDIALLKDAYLSMIGFLSEDLFEYVLQWLLEEAYTSTEQIVDGLVLVRYLEATFLGAHHTNKRRVRRQISRLLTRLTQILQSTQSVQLVVGILDIMAGVCSEPSFELRSWEIGLVLEGIISLMSPATPILLHGSKSASDPAISCALTNQDTSRIFTALYHVLINVARFRQEELTTLIPVFTTILQGIFHGFRSLHGSIAKRQQGVESLIKSPFMLLSAGSLHPEIAQTAESSISKRSAISTKESSALSNFPIGDPLPVECAENFARLLTALGSKGVNPSGSYGSNNSNAIDVPISSSESTSTSGGSFAIATDASKAFGKHAPYILMEYFTIQGSVIASISQQSLRNALLPGLYALLNLCSDWEREMMMVGLDNTGKTLLKGLYADYLKYHKYTGR
ncbi:hypothetical protein BGX21_002576 [Mortierella sp. AD011]|nr:hypothetical protein BGX20_005319 [Mortierella sp. AD010]KAF9401143.1 hypothetical protein BGX21_002576 [Mortierella sp. AD011]